MATDPLRAVTRTLLVMQALQRLGAASLAALHAECQLSKPVLLRLLHTLEAQRFAWRASGDGLWRPAFELRPTAILKPAHQRLIDAALPVMEELRGQVVWPSDLAIREGAVMRLLETTRRASGLSVNRDQIGHRIDMLRSAVGKAWISAVRPAELDKLARLLGRHHGMTAEATHERLLAIRADVNRRGYAQRDPGFGGHDEPIGQFDDQLAAIAVPIAGGREGALGAINIVWLRRFDAKSALLARHKAHLQDAAQQIAQRWRQAGHG